MSDPKPAAQDSASKSTDQTGSGAKFVAIGRLRRELMLIDSGNAEDLKAIAKAAVLEGRAAEVFVVPVAGYFSESEVRWDETLIDSAPRGRASAFTQPPLLNPETGEQAKGDDSKLEATTVAAEREKAEEASKTDADTVDGNTAQREAAAGNGSDDKKKEDKKA